MEAAHRHAISLVRWISGGGAMFIKSANKRVDPLRRQTGVPQA